MTLNRRFEDELANVCRKEQVSLIPYSPIAGGVLSGKYQGGAWPEGARFSSYRTGGKRGEAMSARFVNERTLASTERIMKVAAECELSATTFATAWTLSRDFVASTIIGATRPEQLEDTLKAASVTLPMEALLKVDQISREIMYPMG